MSERDDAVQRRRRRRRSRRRAAPRRARRRAAASRSPWWPTCARRRRGRGRPGTASRQVAASTAELLRHRVDVVHSCVANVAHAEVAEEVLAAGRHIVAEKPLAMDEAAARRLAAAAQAAGVVPRRLLHPPPPAGGAAAARGRRGRDGRRPPGARRLPAGLAAAPRPVGLAARPRAVRGARRRSPTSAGTSSTSWSTSPAGASSRSRPAPGACTTSATSATRRWRARWSSRTTPCCWRASTAGRWSARRSARSARAGATACSWSSRCGDRSLAWSYEDAGDVRVGRQAEGFAAEAPWRRVTAGRTAFYSFLPDVYTAIRGGEPAAPAGDVRGRPAQRAADRRRAAQRRRGPLGRRPRRRCCRRSPRPGSPVLVLQGPRALGSGPTHRFAAACGCAGHVGAGRVTAKRRGGSLASGGRTGY